jgi:hypothetical protein
MPGTGPGKPGAVCATVDANYLTELGLTDRLEVWRDLCKEKLL